MKTTKIFLIIALLCGVSVLFAQTGGLPQTKTTNECHLKLHIDSAATVAKFQKIQGVTNVVIDANQNIYFEYENSNKTIRDSIRTIRAIERVCKKPDAQWIKYQKKADAIPVQTTAKQEEKRLKYNPEIDKLLNIEDESIFADSIFIDIPNDSLAQIHPRSREYYLLIKDIYSVKNELNELKDISWAEKSKAEKILDRALIIILKINDAKKSCYYKHLSESQKNFFKKLKKDYNSKVD